MRGLNALGRVVAVVGLVMAMVLMLSGHQARPVEGQAGGVGGILVVSVVADDPTDADYQAPYTYLVNAGDLAGTTAAAAGSETYQLYDDGTGDILGTDPVGADGSVVITFAAQDVTGGIHVININDPGDGSAAVGVDDVVTVVVNPNAGSAPAAPTQPAAAPTEAAPSGPAPAESTAPEPSGAAASADPDANPAAIYAGDCDQDFSDDPVADLGDVAVPGGEERGADAGEPVRTAFSTLDDLSLGDLLGDDHVLVVFDADDNSVPVACGAVGGIVAGDGSLAIALAQVGASGSDGIAYFSQDGDQTSVTVFLAAETDAGATPAA